MRRHQSNKKIKHDSGVVLTDFKFYNKYKKMISPEDLINLEEQLHKHPTDDIFWTNPELWSKNIGFKFYMFIDESGKITDAHIEIDEYRQLNSLSANEFCSCKTIINKKWYFTFPITVNQETIISGLNPPNGFSGTYPLFSTWKQFVEFIIVNNFIEVKDDTFEEMKETFRELFPTITLKEEKYEILYKRSEFSGLDIFHINTVIEVRIGEKNYRVAKSSHLDRWSNRGHALHVFCEDNKYYNMIDEDRIWFVLRARQNYNGDETHPLKYYFFDNGLTQRSNEGVIINIDLISVLASNVNTVLGQNQFVITPQVYRFYAARFETVIYSNNKNVNEVEFKIIEKYIGLLRDGREVKTNSVILTRTKIEVEGQPFVMKFNKEFINVLEHLSEIRRMMDRDDVKYNFNTLYENILKMSVLKVITMDNTHNNEYQQFQKAVFILNDMKLTVEKVNKRISINGVFCRIEDVFQVLNRAICYTDVNEYNKYIKEVSYIGHEWKRIIGTGVQVELENPFSRFFIGSEHKTMLRFSLQWDARKRTHIYLIVNGEKYLIKQKQKFKHRFNQPRMVLTMKTLKASLTAAIPSLSDNDIIEIVEHAIQEGLIVKQRAQELVEQTVIDIGAVKGEEVISGGKKVGYTFKGRVSGAEYFVDSTDLSTYKKVNGVWNRRCVVNDHSKNRIFEDWLANRLVNVSNEPLYIHTLHNI